MGRGQVVAGTWSSPQGQRKGHRKILIRGEMGIWKDGLSTAEAEAEVASGEGAWPALGLFTPSLPHRCFEESPSPYLSKCSKTNSYLTFTIKWFFDNFVLKIVHL